MAVAVVVLMAGCASASPTGSPSDPVASPPPEPGPQLVGGDGWRLLAHEQGAGEPYRTEVAGDAGAYERLWTSAGVDGPRPEVDFAAEVVIWFGDVYGSSCPDLRLDDVIVADDLIFMDRVILPDGGVMCTDDANPWAWVVAVDRSHLPRGGFAIQLDADDPPAGAPLERTVVTTDLTVPGSVTDPAADPHPAPSPTPPGTPRSSSPGSHRRPVSPRTASTSSARSTTSPGHPRATSRRHGATTRTATAGSRSNWN